jgi:hypothetical protein
MADDNDANVNDTTNPDDTTMFDDDITVNTSTTKTTTNFFEHEMTEQTLRYEIPYRDGTPSPKDFEFHTNLLIALTETFDSTVLRVYTNNNERVIDFGEEKWMDSDYHNKHFKHHDDASQRKSIISHRIRSTKTISMLKNDPTILDLLKKSNTYLRAHFWKEDEVLLKDLGFLSKYVPTKHSKTYVIQDIFERSEAATDTQWKNAPPYQLIHSQPRVRLSGGKTFQTHAFSIQVRAKDATRMTHFLQAIYATEPLFMPYSMKRKFPQAVAKAIVQQNRLISETYVVVVVGITRDVMTSIKPSVMEIPGTTSVSDTNRTDSKGRWHILVQEKAFSSVRKALSKSIGPWVRALPSVLRANTPSDFPAAQVNQKFFDTDDDSSAGQASYMSNCAQSYGTLDDTGDSEFKFFSLSNDRPATSYADAVKRNTTMSTPSVDTATTHPETVEIKSHSSQIAELKAEITIANLQAEVLRLKTQMQSHVDAQTPSTVTEASVETPHPTGDRITKIKDSLELLTATFNKWLAKEMTKDAPVDQSDTRSSSHSKRQARTTDKSPTSTQSNHTKRKDTKGTPT